MYFLFVKFYLMMYIANIFQFFRGSETKRAVSSKAYFFDKFPRNTPLREKLRLISLDQVNRVLELYLVG